MSNRLAQENSLYLRQHADNPVDWFPWGEEALAKARQENKPILLSIGYSACHWCHVMAHESFEDKETAAVMNDLFVNIKVDREERPDLDKIYQMAHQMLSQRSGGWPLTMFLSAQDQSPFYGGTYFPKEPRYGLPSFKDLLQRVEQAYHQQSAEVKAQGDSVSQSLGQIFNRSGGVLNKSALLIVSGQLKQDIDTTHGGFGHAPKFPHVSSLERLLRHYLRSRKHSPQADEQVLDMVKLSLDKMALGGIYDQLGGGFCRYSVDEEWMIPHFEKMLYDNGPLLALYSQMAHLQAENTKDANVDEVNAQNLYHRTAKGIADWAIREMQAPEGGYYATLDADSEGHEGLFYIWTPDQVKALLSEDEYRVFAPRFGLDRKANFEGRWHLHVYQRVDELSQTLGMDEALIRQHLQQASDKLLAVRNERVWPGRDEKVLTAWNALMIRGMAIAARSLQEPEYAASAERALDFIRNELWQEGRLLANYNGGKASIHAYLDDYAFLLDAILELLQYRWRSKDLQFAMQLADVLLIHFEDHEKGGFYFTADDHEQLLQRPKSYGDDSLPSGNAVATLSLLRLGYLLSDMRYLDAAERTLKSAANLMSQVPKAHCALLNAFEDYLHAPQLVILRGSAEELSAWHRQGADSVLTQRLVFAIPDDAVDLPRGLKTKKPLEDSVVAYLCSGLQCEPPITDLQAYQSAL